jgi:hypothetical protein
MKSFHNDQKVKDKYVNRVMAHQAADNLIRGTGWADGKGCAVGCTLENYNHAAYETELGIPEWLARVEDTLFEGMSEEKSRTWPEVFLKAIPVGTDLEKTKNPFLIVILRKNLVSLESCVFDLAGYPEVVKAIDGSRKVVTDMIDLLVRGEDLSAAPAAAWSAAWSAARSAAKSARSAAWSAAWSAAKSAESAESAAWSAWSAAKSAAKSAAWSAESAAWSAESTTWSAAWSAAESAESAAFDYFADELVKLLEASQGQENKK